VQGPVERVGAGQGPVRGAPCGEPRAGSPARGAPREEPRAGSVPSSLLRRPRCSKRTVQRRPDGPFKWTFQRDRPEGPSCRERHFRGPSGWTVQRARRARPEGPSRETIQSPEGLSKGTLQGAVHSVWRMAAKEGAVRRLIGTVCKSPQKRHRKRPGASQVAAKEASAGARPESSSRTREEPSKGTASGDRLEGPSRIRTILNTCRRMPRKRARRPGGERQRDFVCGPPKRGRHEMMPTGCGKLRQLPLDFRKSKSTGQKQKQKSKIQNQRCQNLIKADI